MPHKYSHVLSFVLGSVWAILPEKLDAILAVLDVKMAGGTIAPEEIAAAVASRRPDPASQGAIAVIPIYGVISQRASQLSSASGGTSIEALRQVFRAALADPQIKAIVLDVDSPGGVVSGVDEMATEIYRARGTKPVVAVADTMAASAAYYLAAAASELYVTPSGEVGSIGVFAAHDDVSRANEMQGVRTTLVSAGKYKTEGSPYAPLDDVARAALQERVDTFYGQFTRSVARSRAITVDAVRDGYGEGRLVGSAKAKVLGMVDGIATLDEVIGRVQRQLAVRGQPAAFLTVAEVRASQAEADERAASADIPDVLKPLGEPVGDPLFSASEPTAGPIPYRKAPSIAPDDAPWDGPGEVAKAEGSAELRRMHVWVDDSGDPDAKSSYKGPHHRADGTLVPKGVFALNARLNQMDIPAADRPGCQAHVDSHYREMGRTPPGEKASSVDFRRRRLAVAAR